MIFFIFITLITNLVPRVLSPLPALPPSPPAPGYEVAFITWNPIRKIMLYCVIRAVIIGCFEKRFFWAFSFAVYERRRKPDQVTTTSGVTNENVCLIWIDCIDWYIYLKVCVWRRDVSPSASQACKQASKRVKGSGIYITTCQTSTTRALVSLKATLQVWYCSLVSDWVWAVYYPMYWYLLQPDTQSTQIA